MGRHRANDDGPRTVPLGRLVAGGGHHGDPEPAWDDPPPRRWPVVLALAGVALAAWMGWMLADLVTPDPARWSRLPPAVETVTAEPSPAPTVTRWRTRPPAAGKVVTLSPSPAPTVTRWRTRAPEPIPTVTVFRTRTLAPPAEEPGEVDPRERESPRR
jgi:hypothetical protein